MSELVPDNWSSFDEETQCCHHLRPSQRRRSVTNILLWVQCYAAMVGILASRYPHKTTDFMTYLRTIMKAHYSFIGDDDMAYRRATKAWIGAK